MLKVTKTKITVDEFIKEVEALFPSKFTEGGLRVIFEYIEDHEYGEYELTKIADNFEEWTFDRYRDYIVERFGEIPAEQDSTNLSNEKLQNHLYEEMGEDGRDEWVESVAGFTDSTIVFTTCYTSELEYELKKMYERMRTVSLEQFCKEFECSLDSTMQVFERYKNGSFMDYDRSSRIFHLDFRGITDKEITFEQYVMPKSREEIHT